MQDWDRNDQGNVALCPLLRFQTARARMSGLVRIHYARNEQEFETGGAALQLAMTPVQLRALGEALLKMADTLDAENLGTKQ